MERSDKSDEAFQIAHKADKFLRRLRERHSRMAIVESLKPGEADGAAEKAETLALRGEGLSKVYGGRALVDGVKVVVQPGEGVCFLRPNSGGKAVAVYM